MRIRSQDFFTVQLKNQSQHTVSGRMLRSIPSHVSCQSRRVLVRYPSRSSYDPTSFSRTRGKKDVWQLLPPPKRDRTMSLPKVDSEMTHRSCLTDLSLSQDLCGGLIV